MPVAVITIFAIEAGLINLTILLLVQPAFLFGSHPGKKRQGRVWLGALMLALTFLWSVVVGCVLALNEMTFQL